MGLLQTSALCILAAYAISSAPSLGDTCVVAKLPGDGAQPWGSWAPRDKLERSVNKLASQEDDKSYELGADRMGGGGLGGDWMGGGGIEVIGWEEVDLEVIGWEEVELR
eukprot:TRINITY_DN16440_c0_g1_i1.p1 TRINITY_DN16440_c0_g1~~TRINITY_DN16440_c0_g1_i1.p1  ORF type:complete len:109 (-),score=39.73 TRINITY_DN16440_c0_g1_i1:25-351(-)